MRRYRPTPAPLSLDRELSRWLTGELTRIADSIDSVYEADLSNKAPSKARDGMVVYADGSYWNPDSSSGEGFYGYWNGTWHYFGGGGGSTVGKHSIWVPSSAIIPRSTLGANVAVVQLSNYVMLPTLDFDAGQDEYAQFTVTMPKSWDELTVTAKFVWTHGTASTNFGVVWGLQGTAFSNDDALNTAFSGGATVLDTGGTASDLYISPETSAITIAGTPAEGDFVVFQVYRDFDGTGDDLAVDARLLGVLLIYTTNASTDD